MKKSSRVISTLLLGATLTTMSMNVFAVESKETITKKVLAGKNRYETAIKVSENGWKSADTVVLVNAYAIPDALAATPLAKMKNAPILLTEKDALTADTKAELERLGAKNVILVGGEGVIAPAVRTALENMKVNVERIAGVDRIGTALAVAEQVNAKEVAVVNGYDGLADALSVAAPAAKDGMAIVLSTKDDLRATGNYINDNKIEKAYVIGGTGVVSDKVANELPKVERLGGSNREQTNAKVLEKFYSQDELNNVYVAKDGNPNESELVDALAVGPLAGSNGAPVVLAGANLSEGQQAYANPRIAKEVTEVGFGVNQNTVDALVKALEVKEVTPSENPQVTSITALNTDQFEIKFDQKVDMTSAEDLQNYSVKNSDAEQMLCKFSEKTEDGKYNPNYKYNGKAVVQEDGQTVILTLRQQYGNEEVDGHKFSYYNTNQKDLKVKVENVLTKSKNSFFPKYEKEVNVFDQQVPELKSVNQVGPKEFDLIFSEPVTANNRNDITSAIRINNGQYGFNAETRIENDDVAPNAVRIMTTDKLADGQYNLTIKGDKIYDYANLKLNEVSTTFKAEKNTAPVTMKVDEYTAETVTIKFNKEVKNEENYEKNGVQEGNSNVSYYLDYVHNDAFKAESAIKKDGKLVLTFNHPIPAGNHKIVVDYNNDSDDEIEDLWGNKLNPLSVDFTVAKDTVAPTVTAVFDKDKGDNGQIELKFSKDVLTGEAMNTNNYELRDGNGKVINIKEITRKDGDSKRDFYLVLNTNTNDNELDGTYTLKILGNKIHDTTVQQNPLAAVTLTLDKIDNTPATVTRLVYGGEHGRKILVQYSEPMTTEGQGSILDKTLYSMTYTNKDKVTFNNKKLSDIKDAKIELGFDNTSAIITLPDQNEANSVTDFAIGGVCDSNGNRAKAGGTQILDVNSAIANNTITNTVSFGNIVDNDADLVVLSGATQDANGNTVNFGIDTDILDAGTNAKIISNKEMAIYVLGNITAINSDLINIPGVTAKIDKVTPQASMQKVDFNINNVNYEKDTLVTKLIIKFKDDVFENGFKGNMQIELGKDALTTSLGTNTNALTAFNVTGISQNDDAAAKYQSNSATFVTKDGYATEIQFRTTKALAGVNKYTFDVEGYENDINSASSKGTLVTIELKNNGKHYIDMNKTIKVKVNQVAKELADVNGNKVNGLNFYIEKAITQAQLDTNNATESANALLNDSKYGGTEYSKAITALKTAVDAKDATATTINAAITAFNDAVKEVAAKEVAAKEAAAKEVTAKKTATENLNKELETVKNANYVQDQYTVDSWKTYTDALTHAQADTKDLDSAKINALTASLKDAATKLVSTVSTVTLNVADSVSAFTQVNGSTPGKIEFVKGTDLDTVKNLINPLVDGIKGSVQYCSDPAGATELTGSENIDNLKSIKITAQDGKTTTVYTISVATK